MLRGDKRMSSTKWETADFSRYSADELPLNEQTLPFVNQIAESLPGGFFIYQASGDEEILYLNKRMLSICGCENMEQFHEMTGGTFRGFVYPGDYEKTEKIIRDCIDSSDNNLDYVEYRIKRYDGSIRWIMDYGRLVHSGQYGNVFCVFVDDSTDKNLRAEEDRRAAQVIRGLSEEFTAIYLIDFELKKMLPYSLNGEIAKSMQSAFSDNLDYAAVIRLFADRYVLPADREMYLRECEESCIRRRSAAEKTYNVNFRRYNEQHVLEYIQMTISQVDDDAHSDRVVMAYKNVTAQVKKAQEELRQKQTGSILRAVTEDYVCLIDVNLQTEKEVQYFLGDGEESSLPKWSEADDYSSSILAYAQRIVAEKDRKRFILATELPRLRTLLAGQREFTIEYDAVVDESVRKFQGRFTIHGEESGEKHMFVGIRDITEAERLRFEEEQRLMEAVERADAASRAKTTFLFNMSHDIRTPMNAIIGFSDLAIKHMDERDKLEEYLHNIGVSGNHLLGLINNVLEMSRIESGRMELDENADDMSRAIQEWFTVYADQAKKKNLDLTFDSDIQHTQIIWDSTRIEEVFLNIFSNSVKYTPAGGSIRIRVKELACERTGYARYETVVEDTGIGISEEFLPHIFESFSRERNSTQSRVMGTGLGMGIVKKLLDMMDGDIRIESEQGQGTRVIVTLEHRIAEKNTVLSAKKGKETENLSAKKSSAEGSPAGEASMKESPVKESYVEGSIANKSPMEGFSGGKHSEEINAAEEHPAETVSLEGKRVLMAEDNELNREIAEELLTDAGLLVESAEDGVICVDMLIKAQAGYYDAVLMDIQMPNMDGYTAARTIRALPDKEKAGIPIVTMTANAFEEDKQKAMEAGMDGFTTKPVNMQQLLAELQRVLR